MIEPVDLVFYTSSVDFHNVTSMITTRLEQDGWTCARVLGSSDPNEAKTVFQASYEASVGQDSRCPPMCVAWLSHSRGGSESLHLLLAREHFRKRLEDQSRRMQGVMPWPNDDMLLRHAAAHKSLIHCQDDRQLPTAVDLRLRHPASGGIPA